MPTIIECPDCRKQLIARYKKGDGFIFECQKCEKTYVLKEGKSFERVLYLKPIPNLKIIQEL